MMSDEAILLKKKEEQYLILLPLGNYRFLAIVKTNARIFAGCKILSAFKV